MPDNQLYIRHVQINLIVFLYVAVCIYVFVSEYNQVVVTVEMIL